MTHGSRLNNLSMQIISMFFVAGLFVAVSQSSHAQELREGKVTYTTGESVYIDMGSRQGFAEGDTVRVLDPDGSPVGVVIVEHLSSKSMAARIVLKKRILLQGDRAAGYGSKTVVPAPTPTPVEPTPPARDTARPIAPATTAPLPEAKKNILHGRISAQYYALDNSATSTLDFSQPAAVLSLGADYLMGAPLFFRVYTNHRYDARSSALRTGVTDERMRHRIYEFSLKYGADTDNFQAQAGRFIVPAAGGIGVVDGALLIRRIKGWEAGIAAGTQPGYRDTELSFDDPKWAAYLRYESGNDEVVRYQSSIAFAQTYRYSNIDRGFIYIQNTASIGNLLSLYQNMNIDMYDLASDGTSVRWHISDIFVSGNYKPAKKVSVTASYSVRRNVYLMESFRGLSSEYFDRSLNHNVQVGAGYNIGSGMFVNATASLRTKEGDPVNATAYTGRYTISDFLQSRVNIYISGIYAENRYNKSTSGSIEANRDLLENLYTSIRLQYADYKYLLTSRNLSRQNIAFDAYYRMSKTVFLSLSYEHGIETDYSTDRLYSEITWRF